MTERNASRYRANRTFPQPEQEHAAERTHEARHASRSRERARSRRRRRLTVASYTAVFVQIVCVLVAILCVSASTMLNYPRTLENAFSDLTIVELQRQSLSEEVSKLAEQHHFSAEDMMDVLSQTRLSAFDRKAGHYWYSVLRGAANASAPQCMIEVQPQLLADTLFNETYGAEAAAQAETVAAEILAKTEASAYPINNALAQIALHKIASYRPGDLARYALIASGVLLLLLFAVVVALNDRRHMIRIGWYEGSALVCGGLLALVTRALVSALPVMQLSADTRLIRQLALLLESGSQICVLLSILMVALGSCFMISYSVWIYRCNHYTHNELFGRY